MPEQAEHRVSSAETDLKEYSEVASTWRYFVSIRFIVVGFSATLNSALFTIYVQLFRDITLLSKVGIIGIPLFAFLIGVAVIIVERRTIALYNIMLRRGSELEFQLAIVNGHFARLVSHLREHLPFRKRVTSHTAALYVIYVGVIIAWAVLLVIGAIRLIEQMMGGKVIWVL